jgi:hypothetical protein
MLTLLRSFINLFTPHFWSVDTLQIKSLCLCGMFYWFSYCYFHFAWKEEIIIIIIMYVLNIQVLRSVKVVFKKMN